jgi:alpha-2-macroglobulin
MNPFRSLLNRLKLPKISSFLGRLHWQPPFWYEKRRSQSLSPFEKKERRALLLKLALVTIGLGIGTYFWFHQKEERLTEFFVIEPDVTPLEETLQPRPAKIQFERSAAKLDDVYKTVIRGISMTPDFPGEWSWDNDHVLLFKPAKDWLPGQTYTIRFERNFFAPHIKLTKYETTFKTPKISVTLESFEFYVNPKDPSEKEAVATLGFTHPVDAESIEKHISLKIENGEDLFERKEGGNRNFLAKYGLHRRKVYIRSALKLPKSSTFLNLEISPGVTDINKSDDTQEKIEKTLVIPDIYSFLRIAESQSLIVRNQNEEPEQILLVTTSVPIKSEKLAERITAWQLPKNRPEEKNVTASTNYRWSSPREVTPLVFSQSTKLPLTLIPTEEPYSTQHSFRYNAEGGHSLYFKVAHGLEAPGGFFMKEDFDAVHNIPQLPYEAEIMHDGGILALSGERKLSIHSRRYSHLEFKVGRVVDNQIQHLISQTSGNFQSPVFNNYRFGEENITEMFTEHQALNNEHPSKSVYSSFDFSKYLSSSSQEGHGLFFFRVQGWDPIKNIPIPNEAKGSEESRFVLVTDLGLLVKDNSDGSHDVFVQSIAFGSPVDNVKVVVLGKNGVPLFERKTEADGHVRFPTLKDFKKEREPVAYLATKGRDLSFLPFDRSDRQLNLSRFDTYGITDYHPEDLEAFIFSDRGLYRPGETVYLASILKRRNWKYDLEGIPLEREIINASDQRVATQKFKLPKTGFFEWTFPTRESFPSGSYRADIYFVNKDGRRDQLLGSASFRVQEFLPDRMKIKSEFSKKLTGGWILPKDIKAKITLTSLLGTPAADRTISATLRTDPTSISFNQFPNYEFFDARVKKENRMSHEEKLTDTKTDAEGRASFDLHLERYDDGAFWVNVSSEGYEADGGRSVSTSCGALVSSLDYLIGFKSDGDLSFINKQAERSVTLKAVDRELKALNINELQVRFIERKKVSVLTKQANGNFRYQTVIREQDVSQKPLSITDAGTKLLLPTENPGDFIAKIFDKEGLCRSVFSFSVAGHGNLRRTLEKDAELNVRIPDKEFGAGDEVPIHIVAPYTGAGLITIESDRVYAHQWFRTQETSSVQKIRIPSDFEGNGYLHVSFVRSLDSKEIMMSPLSYAVIPFTVNQKNRTINIELKSAERAIPGTPFKIRYKTDRPAKIIVYAENQGVLQVARYSLPDPLAHFYRKVALQVKTSQIMDLILPEFSMVRKTFAPGGDDSGELLSKNLNPFRRKVKEPVVFWSGIIDSSEEWKELTYNVPDYFNGTLKVMAIASTSSAVGRSEQQSIVKAPLVIEPNLPTFVAPGDEVSVGVAVSNHIEGSPTNITVSLELAPSTQFELLEKPSQPFTLSEGQEIVGKFRLRAKESLGSAPLCFIASAGEIRNQLSSEVSIRPAIPYRTTVRSGYFDSKQLRFPVDRRLFTEHRKLNTMLSPSPVCWMPGLHEYLKNYSYGCTEQLVSKAFPTLVLTDQLGFGLSRVETQDHIDYLLTKLRIRQSSDGSFGYWSPSSYQDLNFHTLYATHFMIEAQSQSYNIPNELLVRCLDYIAKKLEEDPTSLDDARLQAYGIYILTRADRVTTNYLVHLQKWLDANRPREWKNDITAIYLASSQEMLHLNREASDLMDKYSAANDKLFKPNDCFYTRLSVDAQYLYILSRHFPDRLSGLSKERFFQLLEPLKEGHYNTTSAAYSILALQEYAKLVSANPTANLAIKEVLEDQTVHILTTKPSQSPISFSSEARELIFEGDNPDTKGLVGLFYQISETGFDRTLPTEKKHQSIEVLREIRNKRGMITTQAELGETLDVIIRARTLKDDLISNVAIVDLLPSGFEVVPGSISTMCDFTEIREDRIILYTSLTPTMSTMSYQVKPTVRGSLTVPPSFGESMYRQDVFSLGKAEKIEVTDR